MNNEQAIQAIKEHCYFANLVPIAKEALDMAIKALEQRPSDDEITITMKKGTLKCSGHGYVTYNKDWFRKHFATEVQIMTGYDGYIEQPTSDDCVSRQAEIDTVDNTIAKYIPTFIGQYEKIPLELARSIKDVPPVTPTHGICKDCKHWKDSDGVYRRGVGAESKCPLNNSRVFEGTFYCADFEKRGNENEVD